MATVSWHVVSRNVLIFVFPCTLVVLSNYAFWVLNLIRPTSFPDMSGLVCVCVCHNKWVWQPILATRKIGLAVAAQVRLPESWLEFCWLLEPQSVTRWMKLGESNSPAIPLPIPSCQRLFLRCVRVSSFLGWSIVSGFSMVWDRLPTVLGGCAAIVPQPWPETDPFLRK